MKINSIKDRVTELDNGNKVLVLGNNNNNIDIKIENATIEFIGHNNCLVIDEDIKFGKTKIIFKGNNSLCYINKTKNNSVKLNLTLYNNSTFFLGKRCSFNGILNIIVSETMNVLIGEDTMFSFGIWIRTSDVHLMYDFNTKRRINLAKDILIGSHVWVGQNSSLLKGSTVGSGSIIGYGSISTKIAESNAVYVGQPSRKVKHDVIWDRESTHFYESKDIEKSYTAQNNYDEFYYRDREENLNEWQCFSAHLKKVSSYDRIDTLTHNLISDLVVGPLKKQNFFGMLLSKLRN